MTKTLKEDALKIFKNFLLKMKVINFFVCGNNYNI